MAVSESVLLRASPQECLAEHVFTRISCSLGPKLSYQVCHSKSVSPSVSESWRDVLAFGSWAASVSAIVGTIG